MVTSSSIFTKHKKLEKNYYNCTRPKSLGAITWS